MKSYIVFACLFLSYFSVNSQQLYFESGKTISSFDYKNSQGESLDNLQSSNHTYLSLGYRTKFFAKGLFVNFNGNFYEYGAIGSDVDFDNYFEWDLSYLGASLGFDFEIFKPGNFTIYIKASAGAEFLIQGTQTLNDQVFNLSDQEDFDSAIYVIRAGLGMQYAVSQGLSVFTQYMYGTSDAFKDVQGDLKIKTHNIGIGLLVSLKKGQETISEEKIVQIEELKNELTANSEKITALELENTQTKATLENKIAEQEIIVSKNQKEIDAIKVSITNALNPYQGSDMTIEQHDGRVHIVMERELLFRSGSWSLDKNAINTINDLGNFLAKNPDLLLMIEGHADDASFNKEAFINNNWDLSTRRASSIVQILEKNEAINPKNLIIAGRAQYDPIGDNTTEEGKAKNRRITFIIAPKLDDLLKMTKN
ncbi:MAG: OmpA family protein [Psychroserpens sp.]|uniref:OmpA family protein n=1 Tax=Psychroserpens sp. TaxID=2020870 RepID=UPI0030039F3D